MTEKSCARAGPCDKVLNREYGGLPHLHSFRRERISNLLQEIDFEFLYYPLKVLQKMVSQNQITEGCL